MDVPGPTNRWEESRRKARSLESTIDLKLVSFSRLGTNTNYNIRGTKNESAQSSTPLLGDDSKHMVDTMALEIEQLLSKLQDVNDNMSDYVNAMGHASPNTTLVHTLQRHRDILQDYRQEFRKTRDNINTCREREELLGDVMNDIHRYKSAATNRKTDLYLKENEHIRSSERLTDEAINMAMATKENLHSQRKMLGGITNRLSNVANRFPLVNSLIQRVNVRKRRDSIILGCVISTCIILLLLYAFRSR
ncbi:uncharacterized protein TRIADDRAFT_50669 [Trichoplax adhaerens]|uniref:Golgi SNAP receptor complex member 1 n=1 Tax=Trichoplax adhaerens TaxID=10228 RepID=B3S558_TRIAD|nr:hypothetical protein TRIADDRAFT_50669 [Trichoplax adhaerens]EDV22077.1 hypothetical protein TRIADDRAFT_50669 [Trichoplax adhaerens]|eukprot:XP_002115232.1 hypothetical protein TRIADDRAFT_50669 [Trichoplax adhaerens]